MRKPYRPFLRQAFGGLLALATLFLFAPPLQVSASGDSHISVSTLRPENQRDHKKTYFDLLMEPGATQTVQLRIDNPGSEALTVTTALHAASTAQDGLVVYTQPEVRDESMVLSVTDVAHVATPQTLIPAGGSELVDINLAMPAEPFDGVLLGGLNISASSNREQTPEGGGVQINNEYVYVVGLRLTESDTPVAPELHLREVLPGLVNYRTALTVRLQNSEPVLMKNMQLLAQVYRTGSEDIYREKRFESADMAPNSTGDFVVGWESQALEAGSYRLYLRAEHEGRVWEWDEAFQIGPSVAQDANSNAVGISRSRMAILPYTIFLIGLVLLIILWVVRRQSERSRRRTA